MVVEFFGVPGAGKTYLANKAAKKFRGEGKKCENVTDKSRTEFFFKLRFKISSALIRFSGGYKRKLVYLKKLTEEYREIPAKYNDCFIIDYLKAIALMDCLYAKYGKKKGIYIFDEGICQQAANMIVNYGVTPEIAGKAIESCENSGDKIYLETDLDTALSSVKERNRRVCFIDNLEGDTLRGFLISYTEACESIRLITEAEVIKRADGNDCARELCEKLDVLSVRN